MLKHLLKIVGAPILPLDPSGRQIGHFRDLKVATMLKASFQNWLVSRILVAGSMCQIIPVRLVRLLYFKVFISEGIIDIGLLQNSSWCFLRLVLISHAELAGSADIYIYIYMYIYIYVYIYIYA